MPRFVSSIYKATALLWISAVFTLASNFAYSADEASNLQKSPARKSIQASKTAKRNRVVLIKRNHQILAARPSSGQLQGLHDVIDSLNLKSSVAFVVDENTSDVIFSKNPNVALPIASISKLLTSLVVLDANQSMVEPVEITDEDIDTEKGTHSRLTVGTVMSRGDLLHIALMASENRAANALGRNYPGGLHAFVQAMNVKAQALGMHSAHFVEPTGLSSQNVASAEDLANLVRAASANPTIREFTTDPSYSVQIGKRMVAFHNTNALVSNPSWDIAVQKTGFINEAGKCMVMQANIEGRSFVIVLLDSLGRYTRVSDAIRIKTWLESHRIGS